VIERRTFVFNELEHPAFEARGAHDGPRLSLIAGVHGCEYSSIAAVTRFMDELDTSQLTGRITAVPVVSMQSFRQRSPFVVPEDGKNLNRCFPGSNGGTYTERLARGIFDELIAPADALVDLHGGDQVEDLEPFTIYVGSPVEERAHALALAFGLPYVVRQPPNDSGLAGMTATAAADAGVPAIIAEAGGRGILEESAVRMLVDGVRNALRSLDMLPGPVEPPRDPQRFVGGNVWLRSRHEGWWEPAVGPGDEFEQGRQLGLIRNLWGDVLEEIAAPAPGVVLFVTSSPAVAADGLLLGLGTELAALGA
jgi:predicted deacylase